MIASVEPETRLKTTCPRDCYDACGIQVVKQGSRILRVMGDPQAPHNRGTLCPKCTLAYNGAWRDPNARLLSPMKRTGPKGEGRFERVSWDDALSEIAHRLSEIERDAGGAAVVQTHYTGTFSMIGYGFPLRFFNRLGATEVDPDTVCNKAGHVALGLIFGSSMDGFDPRTARDASSILIWGANPSTSAPHAHRHWLSDAPGKVIVVDPIRHATAEASDLHLQPRPGSDAALAFSILHVLMRENLLDRAFLGSRTIGWNQIEKALPACTPEWGEAMTGTPAESIVEAAQIYGAGPSMLWLGQGLQRQSSGGNVFRAVTLLPIATGNIGKPGAGFLYLNGPASRGIPDEFMPAPHLNRIPAAPISHMDLASRLADPHASKALFCWNNNIAASCPNQARLREALKREDLLTVVIDLFATDTTDYADFVLPAASFLEFDDLVISYFHYHVAPQVKAAEPMGESLPNQEIFRRLAARMGYEDPELYAADEDLIAAMLQATGLGIDFEQLKRLGSIPIAPEPVIPFADLSFSTPSGKIEVAGSSFVEAGMPLAPEPRADQPPENGRLRLLSPASPWLMNSSYDNVDKVRKQIGEAAVYLHPREAKARGFADGARVVVFNEAGRLPLTVAYSDSVPRGVALVHKGRWPKLDPSRANVNVLNPGAKSDVGESSSVHSIEVEIAHAR